MLSNSMRSIKKNLVLICFLIPALGYTQNEQQKIDSLKNILNKTTNDSVNVALNIKTGQLVKNFNSNEAQFYFTQALNTLDSTYYFFR